MAIQGKDSQRRKSPRRKRGGIRSFQFDHRSVDGVQHQPSGPFWLYGRHAVLAAIANPKRRCHRLILTAQIQEKLGDTISNALQASGAPRPKAELYENNEVSRALPKGSVHQGIAVQVDPLTDIALPSALVGADERAPVLVLDQASDPQNIGAILRSATAFDAALVVCQSRNAPSETGVLAKAASGALETIPLIRVTNIVRALVILKEAGYWCLGLDGKAETALNASRLSAKTSLILGAEGAGLRRLTRESCDELARIPMSANMASLNISNAAAISLYEVYRTRNR